MSYVSDQKAIEYYLRKKPNIDEMILEDAIDNGIAFIPCKVSGMEDIICKFSIVEHETLDEEFAEYVTSYAQDIPAKYPLALALCGHKFTNDEQKTIASVIKDHFTYELALIRRNNKKYLYIVIFMAILMLVSGFLLQYVTYDNLSIIEYIYVLFWVGAEVVFSFILFDSWTNRKQNIQAGRLASMYIYFDEKYDESDLTDDEANYIKNEVFSNIEEKK